MSDKRKIGPVRQLSLQSENHRLIRPILKKQLSVEQLDRIEEHKLQPRVESAKNKLHDRPRPIKVAWAENRPNNNKEEIPVLKGTIDVKKCKEHKRPTTATPKLSVIRQSSIEKESVLYTRQELAERLRKAWKEREDNKQNLDIFLNQDKHFDDLENENYYPEYEDKIVVERPEEIIEFKPIYNNNNNIKNTKVCKNPETTEFNYIPSTTSSSRPQDLTRTITNISVTIPSVNSLAKPLQDIQDTQEEKQETKTEEIKKPSRPHTASAASKREGFQKRTNTAFTGTITSNLTITEKAPTVRPPLIRALSVPAPLQPSRPENNKLKFIATKRRLKSARKRNNNNGSETNSSGSDENKSSRCKSAPNGDVVTMVSLVSPAGSDTEDQQIGETKKEQVKTNIETVNKTIALRKSGVKSVSFQQSSIHAVRSFSASFPARRGVLTSSASVTTPFAERGEREKRAPMDGEFRGTKRRLIKSFSVAGDDDIKQRNNPQDSVEETLDDCQEFHDIEKDIPKSETSDEDNKTESQETAEINDDEFDPNMPKFETNKERECWFMFKKMSDKGLPVSFDTILRGMLTPTEYRNVRKEMQTTSS